VYSRKINDQEFTFAGSGTFAGFSYDARNAMAQHALEISYGKRF
jgi:hypothetical protein